MAQAKSNGAAAATRETAAKSDSEILDDILYQSLVEKGDISNLTVDEKGSYLQRLCESLKINPLTQPFTFLKLNGKEVAYANRSCTDQLAHLHNITREIIETKYVNDVYVVTCKASMPNGRSDISTGAVSVGKLSGNDLANALMKAETKSKRRAILSICGLGFLDESELDTIPRARMESLPPPKQNGAGDNRSTASRPATKQELVDANRQQLADSAGSRILPQAEIDVLKMQITKLAAAIGMEESGEKTLKFIDESPKDAERAFCKAARVSIKKFIESDKWPLSEDGTTKYLEKFGITAVDDASRGQLEALIAEISVDGLI
jgi:hypothetical protein